MVLAVSRTVSPFPATASVAEKNGYRHATAAKASERLAGRRGGERLGEGIRSRERAAACRVLGGLPVRIGGQFFGERQASDNGGLCFAHFFATAEKNGRTQSRVIRRLPAAGCADVGIQFDVGAGLVAI